MKLRFLQKFMTDDSGAVTVDWVVLTAALVGLSIGVFGIITRESVEVGANVINEKMIESSEFDFTFAADGPGEDDGEEEAPEAPE